MQGPEFEDSCRRLALIVSLAQNDLSFNCQFKVALAALQGLAKQGKIPADVVKQAWLGRTVHDCCHDGSWLQDYN